MKEISIAQYKIGPEHAPFIIAEMSGNHNQSLERALAIVDAAAKAGAQALKIQTYTADTMTLDVDQEEFMIRDADNLWRGTSLYQLYEQAHTPWEWHKPIFDRCRELGIVGFSTPFDATAVDFLESLDVPCYKIASFENTDLPLLKKVAATGKPVIMSTGMASLGELEEGVKTLRAHGCKDIVLLKCTSTYPASPENTHLKTIPHMSQLFDLQVGLSDHTMGIGAAIAAIALGATVVEKHFCLSRAEGGVDSAFSMEPHELETLVAEGRRAKEAMGVIHYGPTAKEKDSLKYRRSLYIAQDLKAGDMLSETNIKIIRPGFGLAPKYYEEVLGKRVNRDVKKGTALRWELLR